VFGGFSAGGRSSVYRFHLDSPIPFTKSIKVTIEHGHANHRSDNFFSVAYWYQTEPHGKFPLLRLWTSVFPGSILRAARGMQRREWIKDSLELSAAIVAAS